jgi:hypothetical protein
MKNLRNFWSFSTAPMTLILALAIVAAAQSAGTTRPNPIDTMRTINDETYRELTNITRETKIRGADNSGAGRAARLKQIRDDFKSIQDINNRMMAQAWAGPEINFATTASMLNEINSRAVRLKTNLALPNAPGPKRNQPNVSEVEQFKSALLGMDRSLMSFVNNPIFRETKVVDVQIAARATQDLDYVIALSTDLKRVAGKLKDAKAAGVNKAQSSH